MERHGRHRINTLTKIPCLWIHVRKSELVSLKKYIFLRLIKIWFMQKIILLTSEIMVIDKGGNISTNCGFKSKN